MFQLLLFDAGATFQLPFNGVFIHINPLLLIVQCKLNRVERQKVALKIMLIWAALGAATVARSF